MPRSDRPWRLTRFNYWHFAGICPQTEEELRTFSPAWIREQAGAMTHTEFKLHLQGGPCGTAGCQLDAELRAVPSGQWPVLALAHYVQGDRLWQQDRAAQAVLKALPACQREQIHAVHQQREERRRKSWGDLFVDIARDQRVFEAITARVGTVEQVIDSIASTFKVSTDVVQKIQRVYGAQRHYLLGNITSPRVRRVLQDRGITIKSLADPTIPRWKEVDDSTPRSLLDYPPRTGVEIGAAAREGMVTHWFAHTLRNLAAYRDRHDPRPFSDACASTCIAQRDRLASSSATPLPRRSRS